MANLEKKKNKIKERINFLETELRISLTKKTSTTKEIDVAGTQRKIQELKNEFAKM
jgi:predicted  nucleic acid-binding Zn-ribbon protein